MANVLERQGKLDEAMAKYEEALDIYVKAYGPNDADVAMTLNNMAIGSKRKASWTRRWPSTTRLGASA